MTIDPHPPLPTRRRYGLWLFLGALSMLLLMALLYLAMMRRASGIYVQDPFRGSHWVLSLDPLPSWRRNHAAFVAPGGLALNPRWWIGTGGPVLDEPSGSSSGGPANRWTIRALPGSRRVATMAKAGGPTPGSFLVERLPPAPTRAFFDAILLENWPTALAAVASMRASAPDAVVPAYWSVALRARLGRYEEARKELAATADLFFASPGPLGVPLYLAASMEAAGSDTGDMVDRAELEKNSPFQWSNVGTVTLASTGMAWPFSDVLDLVARQADRAPAPPRFLAGEVFGSWPPLLQEEILAEAMFHALRGERRRGLDLARGWYTLLPTLQLTTFPPLVAIDIGARDVLPVLDALCIDGAATAEELATDWAALEATFARRVTPRTATLNAIDAGVAAARARRGGGAPDPEASTLAYRRNELRLEAFREAVRVRHYFLTRGAWPERDADNRPVGLLLESAEPPVDPFTDPPRPLRLRITPEMAFLYSIGPDGVDTTATAPDPAEWGGASGDDIAATGIPIAPLFDYPPSPEYRHQDAEDVARRYPQGMPWGLQLTTDGTFTVWTAGPDSEEDDAQGRDLLPGVQVEALYDPTNGLRSAGDVWIRLPMAGEAATSASEAATTASEPALLHP